MAVDSTIASPTNNVLVMVEEASGCCANEFKAEETAFPSAIAGAMQPMLVVNPAVIMVTIDTSVTLSMMYSFMF